MKTITDNLNISYSELLKRPAENNLEIKNKVQEIIEKVKVQGDAAVKSLTKKFDGVDIDSFEIDKQTIANSQKQIDGNIKNAIELASRNIMKFHSA
jgi:histidinol dehydrogenase